MADPTLTGTDLAAAQSETAGNPSPDPAPVQPADGFTAFDADGDALTGARVRISAGFLSGAGHQDVLTINGTQSGSAGAISWSYDPGTGEMILTGPGTFADYEALLDSVGFLATGDNPTDYDADLSRTIAYSVRDDTNYSNEFLAIVTVAGANDAPVSGGTSTASGSEDDLAIAGNVPAASDVDNTTLTYSLVLGSVKVDGISAPDATIAFDSSGNYAYTPTAADQALGDGQSHIITFDYVANDGSTDSTPAEVTITVDGVNDAPVSGGTSAASGSEDDLAIAGSVPAASDVDNTTLTYSLVAGSVKVDGVSAPDATIAFDSSGNYSYTPTAADQALGDSQSHIITFDYVANDGSADSTPDEVTITVNGVNDPPVSGGTSAASGSEDDFVIAGAVPPASDDDSSTLTYSLVAGSVTVDGVSAPDATIAFDSSGNYSYTPTAADQALDEGESYVITFDYIANDGSADSAAAAVTITVNGANDAPFIDLDDIDAPATGTTATYTEGQSPVTIAPFAIVEDADLPANYDGYVVTVTFTDNGTTDDQLEVLSTGLGPSDILVTGQNISYGGILVATFTGGVNGAPLVISFNADACGCSLEAIVAAVAFSNVSATPSTDDREITFTVDDGAATDPIGSAVAILSVVANDPPLLTDLAASVTFDENLVNATPQLLDASVTLTDPDGNFDGATLTISGLLFEDEVTVRNVGTGPGQISVAAGDISYEGILIGTLCGCVGDTVTILFNGDATAASIEAVIENLTYSNFSDSPTPSRTLYINVTDAAGADLGEAPGGGGPPHFTYLAGPASPFDGAAVYGLAAPVFVDLDGDSDLDVVVGDALGNLTVFDNDSNVFTQRPDVDNPFFSLALDMAARPAFIDVDGDSDLDLAVGGLGGTIQYFENVAGVFTERTDAANPFDAILVDGYAAPVFVNLDGDGDLDLVVGDYNGSLYAFRNDGGGVFTELTGGDNPFEAILIDGNATPTFVDLDGDGDLDLVVGDYNGGVSAFQNDGGVFTELTGSDNPFNAVLAYGYASPAFADLDGDGDFDLALGEAFGTIAVYANGPAHGQPIVVNVTPQNDTPFLDLDFTDVDPATGTSASFTEGDPALTIAPFAFFGDPDQPADYGGYVVTVEFTQNGDAADTLTIADIGPGASEIEVSGSDVLYMGDIVGSFIGGTNGDPLVVTFNSLACACSVELTLSNILFSNATQSLSALTRTVTFTLDDGAGGTASADATITVTTDEDAAVAVDDTVSTPENATVNIAVVANDDDPDGTTPAVVQINGNAIAVGGTAILASGATVKLEADGTLTYNPNGKFNTLTNTSSGEIGAVNTSAPDSFTYTLAGAGGGTATVSITVDGVATIHDHLDGDSGNNDITGTPIGDFFDLSQGGNDKATGLGGNDGFFFGAAFTGLDQVNGGGGTNDQIGLQGNYTGGNALVLGPNTITNVEAIVVLPGFSYDITTDNGNVAPGGVLKIQATQLAPGQSLTFNGSAELDGSFIVYGGQGNDTMTGGSGNDGFYFGPNGFSSGDIVNGGPGGNDQLALDGSYGNFGTPFVLGGNVTNVEVTVLLPGPSGSPNSFNLTTNESFVASGTTMTIFGLQVGTDIIFDGSHEHDGAFRFYGGAGNDIVTGSTGNDWIFGGGGGDALIGGTGADTFFYDDASQSALFNFDRITGFDDSNDKIDLSFAVTGFAGPASGNLSAGTFDSDLGGAFAGLTSHQVGLFTATGGDMNGRTFLVIDANGATGYQAGSDFVIEFIAPTTPIDNPALFI